MRILQYQIILTIAKNAERERGEEGKTFSLVGCQFEAVESMGVGGLCGREFVAG